MKVTLEQKDGKHVITVWKGVGRSSLLPRGTIEVSDIRDEAEAEKVTQFLVDRGAPVARETS